MASSVRVPKTVMRRVVKPQPEITPIPTFGGSYRVSMAENIFIKPPYHPGEILYVKETWCVQSARRFDADAKIMFKAGGDMVRIQFPGGGTQYHSRREYDAFVARWADDRWHSSIHMPFVAARIFLRVKSARVERLQDMLNEPPGPECQVVKEGCKYACDYPVLWDRAIKPADRAHYGWEANPYVWRIEFERCEKPKEDT